MIQEHVREMTADERAWVQSAMRPSPSPKSQSADASRAWGMALVAAVTLLVLAVAGGSSWGGAAVALAAGVLVAGYQFVAARSRHARWRKWRETYTENRHRVLARMLEDGRVTVKRVRAVAVVEIQPIEDEGTGYVFDLGDGRVLFLKGQDFDSPTEEDMPWPSTEFEIVRTVVDGTMLSLHSHGPELRPLRVIRREQVDPQKGWDEREEVLEMSLDDAVRTILRKP